MFSLILDIDIDYLILIFFLMAVVCLVIITAIWYSKNTNIKAILILISLSIFFFFASYEFYRSFSYKANSAKEEAIQNYMQAIESKIDPRFKDKFKEQFSSMPNTLGFNLCYENNYTGKTCLDYLFYRENKIKDEVKKAREKFLNDKFNKGEKMNQEIKNIEVPMNENAYKKWKRIPKEMQEKAIEAALTLLWRDEVFFYTFFNGHIEEGEIRIEAKRKENVEFPY
ncbi:TPA: hypothetical protein RZK24_001061 [Campylobacter coli]|nr:hypothetical protein [Campylobacter coli]HEB9318309.1 hypothetical protein [Campylobacter coli]